MHPALFSPTALEGLGGGWQHDIDAYIMLPPWEGSPLSIYRASLAYINGQGNIM